MPVEIQYTKDNGVLVKGYGKVTSAEVLEANEKIYENEDKIRVIRYQLWDFTEIDEVLGASRDIEMIAEQDKQAGKINPGMIIAVVSSKDVAYGFSRMWEALVDDSAIEKAVFRSLNEAWRWINAKLKSHS